MKSDIRYIIKRIIVGVAIALILMLIKGNVFALNYNSNPRSIYTYEKESNTNTNQLNNLTTITSGAQTWYRVPKNRYRLRIQFNFISEITEGYYDVIFNTFNEDRVVFNGYILVGATEYACQSYHDLYVSYPSYAEQGGDQQNLSSGSQTWICSNVAMANNVYMNIWLNGNIGASTNHYVYFSQNINFVPVSNLDLAIQQQTQQQHQDAQDTQNAINDVNDSITSSDTPSGSDTNSAYSNFDNATAQNGVITSLITLPIQLFTNINNSVNQSCTRFDMGTLLGTRIYFNCINPSNYIGSQLWGVIDILMSGFLVWHIAKKFIKVFENLSSLKEGDPVGD